MKEGTLKILDPDWLERLRIDLLGDSDYSSIKRKFKWLIDHYQLLNYHCQFSRPIWRARKCVDGFGFSNISELGAPSADKIKQSGRLNDSGESVFYGSFHQHTILEEVHASDGEFVHIAGFRFDRGIRCGVVGDLFKVHRSGKTSVSDEAGRSISNILDKLPHKAGIGLILLDAFFSEVLANKNASDSDYMHSRALGRQLLRKINSVEGLLYPSVVSEHAMNVAIKTEAIPDRLQMVGNTVVRIVKRYEFGIFDFETVRDADGYQSDGTIVWKDANKPSDSAA